MKKLKIGLVYDLREDYQLADGQPKDFYAEFDSHEVIEAIADTLQKLGHEVEKIGNIFCLINFFKTDKKIDIVFNLSEGLYGRSRESQVPALLDAYQIPFTGSDATTLAITLDKGITKTLVKAAGLATAPWQVVENENDLANIVMSNLSFPVFVKPAYEGSSKGINQSSVVWQKLELGSICKSLLREYSQPIIVEKFLQGREFTAVIVGRGMDVLGVAEVCSTAPSGISGFEDKENWEKLHGNYYRVIDESKPLYSAICELSQRACKLLQCRDISRVDVRCDENNEVNFLEVNPLPSLHPTHSALMSIARPLGYTYAGVIERVLDSASHRAGI